MKAALYVEETGKRGPFKPYSFKIDVETENDHKALFHLFSLDGDQFNEFMRGYPVPEDECYAPDLDYVFDEDWSVFNLINYHHIDQNLTPGEDIEVYGS